MNVSMRLTMDGLIKSLKGFVHDLADELEHSGPDMPRRDELSSRQAISPRTRTNERLSNESRG